MKSFLRWAGSKRLILHHLRRHWADPDKRYVEPFCGSASLYFDVGPRQALLGDLNEELVSTFRAIKADPHLVIECLRRMPDGEGNYYKIRALAPIRLPEAERAARMLYLNHYCFNGIYRTNLNGQFNVPYGPPKSGRAVDELTIVAASKALRNASVIHADFEKTLSLVGRNDFVYLDPPYCLDNRRVFREYLPGSFSLADLKRLADQLRRLDDIGATFVVTYADSSEARALFRPWEARRVRAQRHVAGFSSHRRHAYELIATNRTLSVPDEVEHI
jgi:DNA adenine methylase